MSVRKDSKEKLFIERKEGNQMTTAQTASTVMGEKAHEQPFKKLYNWLYDRLVGPENPSATSVEQLPQDALKQLEREIIQECQEMGMSEDEIEKWLKEI